MKDFEEFVELIEKSVELDPWIIEKGLEGYGQEVVNEANEVLEAIEKKNYENLKEELGDVLAEIVIMSKLAEDKGLFSFNDVVGDIIQKIKRRRPYVLTGEKVSMEKAVRIWYKDKECKK